MTKNICIVYHNAIPLHKNKVKNEPKITSFKTINYNIREYTKNCKIHPNT